MTDIISNAPVLSLCATTGERVKDLVIKDGQMIFVHDKHRIALDIGGKRKFFNQIEELNTDLDRQSILAPISGKYYFVIETAVLWTYFDGWIPVTTRPDEIVFIGTELPALGNPQTLYVNRTDKNISVWNETTSNYEVVADKTNEVTEDDILSLFS